MFCQISTLRSLPAEFWAATAALSTGAVFILKKFFIRQKPKPEYITRVEFHEGMDATRDRIGASYLALADKIELQHNQVLTALDRQGAAFETRLDRLDTAVARLDERTKSNVADEVTSL